jgi:hypothetical protein
VHVSNNLSLFRFAFELVHGSFPNDLSFDKEKNYRPQLNALLIAEVQKTLVADKIDCANPNALVDVYENKIAITTKGLVFYFVVEHLDYEDAMNCAKVLLP